MTTAQREIRAAARDWALRARDVDFDDWDRLTEWLERDPANAEEYDRACDDDEWVDALFATPPVVSERAPRKRATALRHVGWPMAAAAAIGALGLSGWYLLDGHGMQTYATAGGERRTLVLDRGTRIVMNGSTRLTVAGPRRVNLIGGQAIFEVRHDAGDPFVLAVGKARIVDAGTVFDVSTDKGMLAVGVAEGEVVYRVAGHEVKLKPGQSLSQSEGGQLKLQRADPTMIGAWRSGYLAYVDTTLEQVAADLSRNLGRTITVDRAVEARRFSGTLRIDGNSQQVLATAGPLLGVDFKLRGEGWMMTSTPGVR